MRVKTVDNFRVWEIKESDSGKSALVQLQESRKVNEENAYDKSLIDNGVAKRGYVNTNYFNVKFIAHAYNKLKEIEIGDSITNVEFEMKKEPYYNKAEEQIVYPNYPNITVTDFTVNSGKRYNLEFVEAPATKGINMDKAPKVEESTPEPVVEEVDNSKSPEDICPF